MNGVRCSDCKHGTLRRYCPLRPKIYCNRSPRICRLFEWRPEMAPRTIEQIRADLAAAGLAGHVIELVPERGQLLVRLVKGLPCHVKRAVGQVMRT